MQYWPVISWSHILTFEQFFFPRCNLIFLCCSQHVSFLHEITPIQWIFSQYCGYLWSGRLKIACAERALLKPEFWNEWMNEKNILGFKLCAEAENFFQMPCLWWPGALAWTHYPTYILSSNNKTKDVWEWLASCWPVWYYWVRFLIVIMLHVTS